MTCAERLAIKETSRRMNKSLPGTENWSCRFVRDFHKLEERYTLPTFFRTFVRRFCSSLLQNTTGFLWKRFCRQKIIAVMKTGRQQLTCGEFSMSSDYRPVELSLRSKNYCSCLDACFFEWELRKTSETHITSGKCNLCNGVICNTVTPRTNQQGLTLQRTTSFAAKVDDCGWKIFVHTHEQARQLDCFRRKSRCFCGKVLQEVRFHLCQHCIA